MIFNVEWKKDKRTLIITTVMFAVMLFFCLKGKANILAAVLGTAAYYFLNCIAIKLSKKVNAVWIALILFLSALLNERLVQYLLLDTENREKISSTTEWLNVFCCLIWMLVFLVVTAKLSLACGIGFISLMILSGINYFVYQFRGNEFSYGDFKGASTGLSVASKYNFVLDDRAVYTIIISILYVVLIRKIKLKINRKWMVRLGAVAAAAVFFSYIGVQTENTVMESWEQKGTYRNGYILNFALGIRDSFVAKPEGYSQEVIAALENKYGTTIQESSEEDPTIIVIMNESFADLRIVGELSTTKEVTPFYDSLSENTLKGNALVSVFGAKTPNSEWEFLTGNTMAFLPSGSVPYQQYISGDTYSLTGTLKERNYTCLTMHPYYETGWSRSKVYPLMGFDKSYFIDEFDQSNILREYITDAELYDKIIDQFEAKDQDEKLFIMSITMQNHGGYTDTYTNFTNSVYLTDGYYSDVSQYLSLIHESDQALEELITYFENVDEKVEIVFFGDHQPSLNTNLYRELNGKGLSGLTLQELEDLFTVPFFIWTNYESEEGEVELTSLNYLSTLALEKADIELPSYNRFLKDLMEYVPAINARAYYSNVYEMFIHFEDEITAETKELLQQYEILQYNNIFDADKSSVLFPLYESEECQE